MRFRRTVLFAAAANSLAVSARQTTRKEITLRDFQRRGGALLPRNSPTVCPVAANVDARGVCCSETPQPVAGFRDPDAVCCPDAIYPGGACGELLCCPGGASSISTRIIPATDEIPEETLKTCCREADQRPVNDGTATAECQSILTKREHPAFDLATPPVRRGIWDDPLRQMSFRDGTIRAQISPHLLADLLVNDWEFDYRGRKFIDYEARDSAGSGWRSQLIKRMPNFVKRQGSALVGEYIARSVARGEQYIPIPVTHDYEIHVDDIPDLYTAIKSHPNFNGAFYVNGAEWGLDLIRTTISKHPGFNATLHDL